MPLLLMTRKPNMEECHKLKKNKFSLELKGQAVVPFYSFRGDGSRTKQCKQLAGASFWGVFSFIKNQGSLNSIDIPLPNTHRHAYTHTLTHTLVWRFFCLSWETDRFIKWSFPPLGGRISMINECSDHLGLYSDVYTELASPLCPPPNF